MIDEEPLEEQPEVGQVRFELHEWSSEARRWLDSLLRQNGIPLAWEAATLVVDATQADVVEGYLDEVGARERSSLDPDADKTVYEVSTWSTDQLGVLTGALAEAGIAYEFDLDGDLAVLAADEERVEALLDTLELGPAEDGWADGDDDGLETAAILSDLFVACDRLHHNPHDAEGILGAVAAAERLSGRSLPFGYEPRVWETLLERTLRLKSVIEDDRVPDEVIVEDATGLRTLLRQYV